MVYLVRKIDGIDDGKLYAMKVLKKSVVAAKKKTAEHTRTERQVSGEQPFLRVFGSNVVNNLFFWISHCPMKVLEAIHDAPYLVTMHYAFQTDSKLYLIMDFLIGGELFTHLYRREHFDEHHVRIYIAEIILAIEQLHKVGLATGYFSALLCIIICNSFYFPLFYYSWVSCIGTLSWRTYCSMAMAILF